ncbi:MAG: methyltransferase domain-containing protein [Opitutales bacterium]|nr:methyltransferase domain-containing protein [Opitutales bacterium]
MKPVHNSKRETDLQIIGEWIEPGSRVLDLGCGRGVLLENLRQKRQVNGIGVDTDVNKVESCVKRGVPVYQGDAETLLKTFERAHFDWVVLSRTVQELENPATVIEEALRVGKRLAVGFANHGYWRNRLCTLLSGSPARNEIHPAPWPMQRPHNPVSIAEFEEFCKEKGLRIIKHKYLGGDWKSELSFRPSLRAAYALYALGSEG